MRFVTKMFAVGVAGIVVTSTAPHSYAQGPRELGVKAVIYLGTVVIGTIWGTKAAEAQEKAAEARRRAEEEARAKAEREEAERRLRALERSAAEARAVEEAAKLKAEREAADRRFRELIKSLTAAPPPPPSPTSNERWQGLQAWDCLDVRTILHQFCRRRVLALRLPRRHVRCPLWRAAYLLRRDQIKRGLCEPKRRGEKRSDERTNEKFDEDCS